MLHRLDEIFLEFLHHGACGFHAVDQADALADKIADEVARLRVACGRGAVDRGEGVAAGDAAGVFRGRPGWAFCPGPGAAFFFPEKISWVSDSTVASHTEPVQTPAAPI